MLWAPGPWPKPTSPTIGNAEGAEQLEAEGVDLLDRRALGPAAERDAGDAVEPAGSEQGVEVAVDPVGRLGVVLEQRDAAAVVEWRAVACAGGRRQQRQVAADEPALGVTFDEADGAGRRPLADGSGLEHRGAECVAGHLVVGHDLRAEHRGEPRRHAELLAHPLVQRRDVRAAIERLGLGGRHGITVEQVEDAYGAIAAADAEDARDGGVAPGLLHVVRAYAIVAGQVVGALVDRGRAGTGDRLEAPRLDQLEGRGEELGGCRSGGGDERDPVAGPHRAPSLDGTTCSSDLV